MEKKVIKKQTGVRIDADMLKTLKHLAVDTGRSVSSLMGEAVEELLKKYSNKSK